MGSPPLSSLFGGKSRGVVYLTPFVETAVLVHKRILYDNLQIALINALTTTTFIIGNE